MDRFGELKSHSEEETFAFGFELGRSLQQGAILCFFGDLGAGKTTFIKGVAAGFARFNPALVNSPTFVYLNIYRGSQVVYHFDLYRLRDADEFLSMGFEEHLFAGGICCIEWSERINEILPSNSIHVKIEHEGNNCRNIWIKHS